jgi:hypothetical protein
LIDYLMIKFLLGNPYGTSSQKVQSISFFLWKNKFFFFFFEKKSIDRNEGKLTGGHLIKIWDNCVTSIKMKFISFCLYVLYVFVFMSLFTLCVFVYSTYVSLCLCLLYVSLCILPSCLYVFMLLCTLCR